MALLSGAACFEIAIQYQSWFSFRVNRHDSRRTRFPNGRNPVSILVFIPSRLTLQKEGGTRLKSQSSINPGFHSEHEFRKEQKCTVMKSRNPVSILVFIPSKDNPTPKEITGPCRNPVSILVFIPRLDRQQVWQLPVPGVAIQYQSWFSFRGIPPTLTLIACTKSSQSSINPGFHSESLLPAPKTKTLCKRRNPVSILVFIPSRLPVLWVSKRYTPSRNPVSILVFIPSWKITSVS